METGGLLKDIKTSKGGLLEKNGPWKREGGTKRLIGLFGECVNKMRTKNCVYRNFRRKLYINYFPLFYLRT